MAIALMKNPEMLKALKEYVDTFDDYSKVKWGDVAYYMKNQCNLTLSCPTRIQGIYEALFMKRKELDLEEIGLLIKIGLQEDFEKSWRFEFQKVTQSSREQCKNWFQRYFLSSLQIMINMLSKRKTFNLAMIQTHKLPFSSIKMFLNMYKAQQQDPLIQEIKAHAIILRKLYLQFAEYITIMGESRACFYKKLSQVCSRQTFERIIYYLEYVNYLKLHYENRQKVNIINHPLINQNIDKLTKTPLYCHYIEYSDVHKMYLKYQECLNDGEVVVAEGQVLSKPVNEFRNVVKKKPRFGIKKVAKFRSNRTILFHNEDELQDDGENENTKESKDYSNKHQVDTQFHEVNQKAYEYYFQ